MKPGFAHGMARDLNIFNPPLNSVCTRDLSADGSSDTLKKQQGADGDLAMTLLLTGPGWRINAHDGALIPGNESNYATAHFSPPDILVAQAQPLLHSEYTMVRSPTRQ